MPELLKENNIALRHDIEHLQRSLTDAQGDTPKELQSYIEKITNKCNVLYQRVLNNLKYLEFGLANLSKDILSETELVTRDFYSLNGQQITPILRARASDRLALKLLLWLHATHSQAKNIPSAVSDGEFSIWLTQTTTIYCTPCTSQQGLRNLPIFFHEFGHLLYRLHQLEMNDLVNELQAAIRDLLRPSVERNDEHTQTRVSARNVIVDRWYEWSQECFCDAIGFVMGGPSFAYAFSTYLRILGRSQYHMSKEELANSAHPVTWIRIQLLTNRARQMGYDVVATDLEEKWNEVATALGVIEDYDGFYDPAFLPVIQQKLDDMLTETAPREFRESEISNQDEESVFTSPVALLNRAWQKFQDDPDGYREWEENAIEHFLDADIQMPS